MSFFVGDIDMSDSLDRHITGNWGEDSVDHEEEDDPREDDALSESEIDDIERIYREMRR